MIKLTDPGDEVGVYQYKLYHNIKEEAFIVHIILINYH